MLMCQVSKAEGCLRRMRSVAKLFTQLAPQRAPPCACMNHSLAPAPKLCRPSTACADTAVAAHPPYSATCLVCPLNMNNASYRTLKRTVAAVDAFPASSLPVAIRHIDQDDHLAGYGAEEARRVASMALFRGVFVDLYLLSRASCMLTSRSGFSKAALWMADNDLMHCHRVCGCGRAGGP